jgi:hypothetical protein
MAAAALAAAGCGGYHTNRPAAEKIAERQYDQAYKGSSPTGKFALQYLLKSQTGVHRTSEDGGDNRTDWAVTINNGCLGGSSYNINGGTIHASASARAGGLFSVAEANASVDAQIPTAAAYWDWTPKSPNDLTIHSGNRSAPALHFTGVEGPGPLKPTGQQTLDKLSSAGCAQGVVDVYIAEMSYGEAPEEHISPWMVWSDGKH